MIYLRKRIAIEFISCPALNLIQLSKKRGTSSKAHIALMTALKSSKFLRRSLELTALQHMTS